MGRITRNYFRGRKSTSLETTKLVYDPVDDDWYASWVYKEELDRRRARPTREKYAEFKRLIASGRSS